MGKIYLVDSENVGDIWVPLLAASQPEDEVIVFYTQKSPHMNYENVRMLKETEKEADFIKCFEGNNALDFQLVTELGYRLHEKQDCDYVIVSNDTGFDAAVRYWAAKEMPVSRLSGKECYRQLNGRKPQGAEKTQKSDEQEPGAAAGMQGAEAAGKPQASDTSAERQKTGAAAEPTDAKETAKQRKRHNGKAKVSAAVKAEDGTSGEASDRASGELADAAAKKGSEKASDESVETTSDGFSDKESGKSSDEASGEPTGTAIEKASDGSEDAVVKKTSEDKAAAAVETASNKSTDVADEKTSDTPTDAASKEVSEAMDVPDAMPEEELSAEAADAEQTAVSGDDVIETLFHCISKENLVDFHNALVALLGEDAGKQLYQEIKGNAGYTTHWSSLPACGQKEKFELYCRLVFDHSEFAGEAPEDFAGFLYQANGKRKNLNSLRAALQGHYGKDKGMKYYSLFKSHIKIMHRM